MRRGVGVEPSLRAFARGYDVGARGSGAGPGGEGGEGNAGVGAGRACGVRRAGAAGGRGISRWRRHGMIAAGLQRVVDFQDLRYGREYLTILAGLRDLDSEGHGHRLLIDGAKYVAASMAYDDVIRIADLKTRSSRFRRVESEVAAKPGQIIGVTEFMHPRTEEVCGLLPPWLGRPLERSRALRPALDWVFDRGRRVRTDTIRGFLTLYVVAGLRGWRRWTLRHRQEMTHRDALAGPGAERGGCGLRARGGVAAQPPAGEGV